VGNGTCVLMNSLAPSPLVISPFLLSLAKQMLGITWGHNSYNDENIIKRPI